MQKNNPLYQNQGIHVMASIFTIEKGIVKVLLIKRKNEPFKGMWALPGGALYNNEDLEEGLKREIKEKTGIKNIKLELCGVYGKKERKSNDMRMVGISYLGVISSEQVSILKETSKTSDADWIDIKRIPQLAYDHNEVIRDSLEKLKTRIVNSNILKSLFPNGFTIPEIKKAYEAILNKVFDRRNFRRKLLNLGIIEDTLKETTFEGKKKAKLYCFKENIEDKNVF